MKARPIHWTLFVFILFCIAAGFSCPLGAQGIPPPAETRRDDYVSEKGFRSAVFEVKHREPNDLAAVVRPLGSGFRGATVSWSSELKTLTVRDFPENVAAIGEALKRLDVPEAPRTDVELHIYVLVASRSEGASGRYPEELAQAIAALGKTMGYRRYELAGVFTERIRDGSKGIGGEGSAAVGFEDGSKAGKRDMQVDYRIARLSIDRSAAAPVVRLEGFNLALVGGGNLALVGGGGRAQVRTDVGLRAEEKVVVGTAALQDKALIVVLSARPLPPP
jgi:hypothetical protein